MVLLGSYLLDWPEHACDSVVLGSRASGLEQATRKSTPSIMARSSVLTWLGGGNV